MSVCETILNLKTYKAGKHISQLKREMGLKFIIKLASNENPLAPGEKVVQAINNATKNIRRYPDSNGFKLKRALSKHLDIKADNITLGNGSNDVLELIARAYVCTKSDEVIFSQYAFLVYSLITQALGAKAVVTKANNFAHDLDAMLFAISKRTKVIFIANPNNPTGTLLTEEQIDNFLLKVPKNIIVVLDQAYFEYLNIVDNAFKYLAEFANLIITRSFSKAYGLAGLRVGYALSSSQIAYYLNCIRQPFNVNSIALAAATAAIDDKDYLKRSIDFNNKCLAQLASGFDKLGLSYIDSHTNFIAVKVGHARETYKRLLAKGFIVRPIEIDGYLRVSIGSVKEINGFIKALGAVL